VISGSTPFHRDAKRERERERGKKGWDLPGLAGWPSCCVWERMAGTTRLELATSAVTEWKQQVLTTIYKVTEDCQVLENMQ
jgi:hypothetical protein